MVTKTKPSSTQPIHINLLDSKRLDATHLGKAINWALTIGKTIVFLTFTVVIGMLFYRFSLDRKIEIINDKIEANIAVIDSNSAIEGEIRKVQEKTKKIRDSVFTAPNTLQLAQKIENNLPPTAILQTLSFNFGQNVIYLKGTAPNEIIFSQMLNALKQQQEFTEISVDEMKSGGVVNPTVDFAITIFIDSEKKI